MRLPQLPKIPVRLSLPLEGEARCFLVLLSFSLIFFSGVIFLGAANSSRLFGQIRKGREFLKILDQKVASLAEAEAAFSKIRNDTYLLDEALPDNYDPSTLIQLLSLTLGRRRLTLKMVRFEPIIADSSTEVSALPFTLSVTGRYTDFLKALADLEQGARQIDTQDLRLARFANRSELEINLRLTTYFYSEE